MGGEVGVLCPPGTYREGPHSLVPPHICWARPIACYRCLICVNGFVKIKKEPPWLKSDSLPWHLFRSISWLAGWSFHFVCWFIQQMHYCGHQTWASATQSKRGGMAQWYQVGSQTWLAETKARLCNLSELQLFLGKKGKGTVPTSGLVYAY